MKTTKSHVVRKISPWLIFRMRKNFIGGEEHVILPLRMTYCITWISDLVVNGEMVFSHSRFLFAIRHLSLFHEISWFWVGQPHPERFCFQGVTSPQIFSQISNWSYMFLMKKVPKYQFGSDKDLLWIYIRSKSGIIVIK